MYAPCVFLVQCLWLRVRITLLRCFKEAMSLADDPPTRHQAAVPVQDPTAVPLLFTKKYMEFAHTLEEMESHVGMLYLNQKKNLLVSATHTHTHGKLEVYIGHVPSP